MICHDYIKLDFLDAVQPKTGAVTTMAFILSSCFLINLDVIPLVRVVDSDSWCLPLGVREGQDLYLQSKHDHTNVHLTTQVTVCANHPLKVIQVSPMTKKTQKSFKCVQ